MFNFYMIVVKENGTKSYWWNVDGADHMEEALVENLGEEVVEQWGGPGYTGTHLFSYQSLFEGQIPPDAAGTRQTIGHGVVDCLHLDGQIYVSCDGMRPL